MGWIARIMVAAVLALPATASAQDIAVEGGLARANDRWGGEFGIGYNLRAGPLTLRPIAGAFVFSDNDDRFRREGGPGEQVICRDTSTGRFASRSECGGHAARLYGKIEATATIPLVAEIGVGARFSGERARLYGAAAVALLPAVKLKGNVGQRYAAIGLMASF